MSPEPAVTLGRLFTFRAAHKCWRDDWTEEDNHRVFGACASRSAHGHTYTLEVVITGPIDPVTGMIINVTDLKAWVGDILKDFDYRDLNQDVSEFRDTQPTLSNLARVLVGRIAPVLPTGLLLHRIRIRQDDGPFVDCFPASK
ncbi:MAG: 6-carboxytetrahydropterin synthase [bacterium JZ-2024 1]